MEVYPLLDAIRCIDGDVRYFLCGLEPDVEAGVAQPQPLDTEEACLEATRVLMRSMQAYYSAQMEEQACLQATHRVLQNVKAFYAHDIEARDSESEEAADDADEDEDDDEEEDVDHESLLSRVQSRRILDDIEQGSASNMR